MFYIISALFGVSAGLVLLVLVALMSNTLRTRLRGILLSLLIISFSFTVGFVHIVNNVSSLSWTDETIVRWGNLIPIGISIVLALLLGVLRTRSIKPQQQQVRQVQFFDQDAPTRNVVDLTSRSR